MDIQETTRRVEKESVVLRQIMAEVEKVVVGQKYLLERMLIGLLCDGHLLLEGVPGLAKTTAVKTLAATIKTKFQRIQFTPDLLPADILGTQIYRPDTFSFEIRQGPIFHNIILADEINRAPAKVQSALLEAMQERQVTVDLETLPLPRPFMVLATQNPIELEGTFPLPEAQVDRFLMRVALGYPSREDENAILLRYEHQDPLETLEPVAQAEDLLLMQEQIKTIQVEETVREYMVDVVRATRDHEAVELGVSPRGSLALYRTAQALAALRGRAFVIPDDVKWLAPSVLTHRIIISPQTRLRGRRPEEVVSEIVDTVPVPVEV